MDFTSRLTMMSNGELSPLLAWLMAAAATVASAAFVQFLLSQQKPSTDAKPTEIALKRTKSKARAKSKNKSKQKPPQSSEAESLSSFTSTPTPGPSPAVPKLFFALPQWLHNLIRRWSLLGGFRQQYVSREELIWEIERCLNSDDLDMLRRIAAEHGLVSASIRRRAWPKLAGVNVSDVDVLDYQKFSEEPHRDRSVVEVDVERSLWAFTVGMSTEERAEKRTQLRRLINSVVAKSNGTLYYYQGFHDVAAVMLMVMGEDEAYPLLEVVATHYLHECMLPDLHVVLRKLELLPLLVRRIDRRLAEFIVDSGAPPYFAISWPLTWFAHDVTSLEVASRLFDLFLASSTMMPLYFGAVAIHASRKDILALEHDPAIVHSFINKMPAVMGLSYAEASRLALKAAQLHHRYPPRDLENASKKDAATRAREVVVNTAKKNGKAGNKLVSYLAIAAGVAICSVLVGSLLTSKWGFMENWRAAGAALTWPASALHLIPSHSSS